MSEHHPPSSDVGAAFAGLIGGALFIGAILFGIVVLTNRHFANEKAEGGEKGSAKTSLVASPVTSQVS